MLEREMDIWDAPLDAWVGITTNGTVKWDGRLVMGRGVAREARDRYHGFDLMLGSFVNFHGNRCCFTYGYPPANPRKLYTFPVKHHWRNQADLVLIGQSAKELDWVARGNPTDLYYLPRPGCGNGGLRWEDVRPVIKFLPDNVIVVDRPAGTVVIPTLGGEISSAQPPRERGTNAKS